MKYQWGKIEFEMEEGISPLDEGWVFLNNEKVFYKKLPGRILLSTSTGALEISLESSQSSESNRQEWSGTKTLGLNKYSSQPLLKPGEAFSLSFQSGARKNQKVKSQMPGKILAVKCRPGDEVKKDQTLLIMEAMKMENEVKSPIQGKIKNISVQEGQVIESSVVLLEIEK